LDNLDVFNLDGGLFLQAFNGLSFIVVVATFITSFTPSRSDDLVVDKALSVLNILAGNVGLNRNADDK
jgi:hypothetical protein